MVVHGYICLQKDNDVVKIFLWWMKHQSTIDQTGYYPNIDANPFSNQLAMRLSDRSKNAGSNINEQRGNPNTKDWYFFFGVTLNFKLNPKPLPCHAYGL